MEGFVKWLKKNGFEVEEVELMKDKAYDATKDYRRGSLELTFKEDGFYLTARMIKPNGKCKWYSATPAQLRTYVEQTEAFYM